MEVYGNKTWNNATDNREKTLVPMAEETFKKYRNSLKIRVSTTLHTPKTAKQLWQSMTRTWTGLSRL